MAIIDPAERATRGHQSHRDILNVPAPAPSTPYLDAQHNFVFAEVWTRPTLSRRVRRWIAMSCIAASHDIENLDLQVRAAMESGDISLVEMREFSLHFSVYCGWPLGGLLDKSITRAAEALNLSDDNLPIQAKAEDADVRIARGSAGFESVMTFPGPQPDYPYHVGGILPFVFGEMWDRPGLDRLSRRWITLACLGVSDTRLPIESHIYAAMKSGQCSFDEMMEFVLHFAVYAGWPKAQIMQQNVWEKWERIQNDLPCF